MGYGRAVLPVALLCLAMAAAPAPAADSYGHFYGSLQGLQAGEIAALAQDQTGFIWIGSQGGLYRFDGNHFTHFAAQQIPRGVTGLWWDVHTGLLIRTERNQALVENAGQVRPLLGPNAKPVTDLRGAAFDRSGQLWAIIAGTLWRRDRAAHWTVIPASRFNGEQPLRLWSLAQGIALITDRSAWRFDGQGNGTLLLHRAGLFAAAGGGKYPLWLTDHEEGDLWRQEGGRFVPFRYLKSRVLDMRYRGNTLWVSVDRYLLAIAPDDSEFTINVKHGLPSGGPLLVDHEGSLWVGTFVGLQQYPEPDTQHWSELDGLPWQHAYNVAAAAGQVWVNTWDGAVRFDTRRTPVPMIRQGKPYGVLCADREDRVWQIMHGQLMYWRDGRYVTANTLKSTELGLGGCMPAEDGGTWLATTFGIFHAARDARNAQRVAPALDPGASHFTDHVWQASDGSLWATAGDTLCHYQLTGLTARLLHCMWEPFEQGVSRVAEIAPGRYWLTTSAGLFLFDGHSVRLLPGNENLPGLRFNIIEPARSGGYWAIAPGALDRIEPCDKCAAGFHILESVGAWQGVPTDSAKDIVELESGGLWIAGNRGVFHIPAKARPGPESAPPLVLVGVTVDGPEQLTDAPVRLRPRQKQLSLEFAALSFRDRSLLRYRFRTSANADWSLPTTNPELQIIAPRPGNYRISAQASFDSVHWSAPVGYTFSVAPPWYETWWARLAGLLLVLLLAATGVRLWLEYKLRLERQRVRIALDLHDELGSTLGAIGMLAGAMARRNPHDRERRQLLGDINDAVARMSGALRTVVWSMRQPDAGVRQLFTEISDQARHLFPGSNPAVHANGPAVFDDVPLDPDVRRHVLMVALETMHNVARHARAREVVLSLLKQPDGVWRLEIRDDGGGFDSHAASSGSGLESMRRRARLIRAKLALYSEPGAGTTVTLDFHPRGGRA